MTTHHSLNAEYWWFQILLGIVSIALGIWFMVTPIETYITFVVFFSMIMLFTGFFELANSVNVKAESKRWVLYFLGGIIDIILGIILIKTEDLNLQVLPILLGIWFLVRAIIFLMLYFELKQEYIQNSRLVLLFAILTLLLSLAILANPVLGQMFIVYTVGLAFFFMGLFRLSLGGTLHRSRKNKLIIHLKKT